jgi:ketosteroid isomerase-like protein
MKSLFIMITVLLSLRSLKSARTFSSVSGSQFVEFALYGNTVHTDLEDRNGNIKILKQMTNREILEKANQAFSRGDYEEFLSYCTEDTKWTYVGDRTLDGKDKVREYLAAAYEESTYKIEKYVEEGESLVAIGWIKLKDKEGNLVTYSVCDVWKFRNGKMAELKAFVIKD